MGVHAIQRRKGLRKSRKARIFLDKRFDDPLRLPGFFLPQSALSQGARQIGRKYSWRILALLALFLGLCGFAGCEQRARDKVCGMLLLLRRKSLDRRQNAY